MNAFTVLHVSGVLAFPALPQHNLAHHLFLEAAMAVHNDALVKLLSPTAFTRTSPCVSRLSVDSRRTTLCNGRYLSRKVTASRALASNAATTVEMPLVSREELDLDSCYMTEDTTMKPGFAGIRKTKVVCTIGPSCCSLEALEKLAMGGMNVARLNMCHNSKEWHRDVIRNIKWLNAEKGYCVSVIVDTQGSLIHVLDHGHPSSLKAEEGSVWLFTSKGFEVSRPFTVQANFEEFSQNIEVGDELIIDGGMATFIVIEKLGTDLRCKCTDPGLILPQAKICFWRDGILSCRGLPTLSKKDWDDIDFAIAEAVDFIAVSFVNDSESVERLKKYLSTKNAKSIRVISKIETLQSLQNLKEIVESSDGIMVARGDLGVEVPLEHIPSVQENITKTCRELNKPVIIASQLLESMIEYPIPTRAEVNQTSTIFTSSKSLIFNLLNQVADVSDAVHQSADAMMLSGESAIGLHAQKALSVLHSVSRKMEQWNREDNLRNHKKHTEYLCLSLSDRIAEQICNSAAEIANNIGVDAIFVYTKHGQMASLLSRNRPNPPIIAFTDDNRTRMALNLLWGVTPQLVNLKEDMKINISMTFELMKSKSLMKEGDVVLIVSDLTPFSSLKTSSQSIKVIRI